MEVCFSDLKEKEIVNVFDGKKLGRIIDILFDTASGSVRGIVVPGDKKLFRKNDDIFVPLEKLKKIGDDVILVSLQMGKVAFPYDENPKSKRQNFAMQNRRWQQGIGYENSFQNSRENLMSREVVSNKNNSNSKVQNSYIRFRPISEKKYK